jgi:hypothetical protein
MPDITKNIANLMKKVDKLVNDAQKDIAAIIAAGKEIKESLPKKADKPDDKQEA